MEKLDNSIWPADRTGGNAAHVIERKTLTRCCSIPQQLSSVVTGKLGTCVAIGDKSSRSPEQQEPAVAIGTGLYFQKLPSNCYCLNSDCDICELQDLFNLATVACEVEAPIRHRQLVKKRRTPRNFLCINASTCIANSNRKRIFPASGAVDTAKTQRIGNLSAGGLSTPPWLIEKSALQDPRAFVSKLTSTSIRDRSNTAAILKVGSQERSRTVGGKMMAANQPPKKLRFKFTMVSTGKSRLPSVLSSSKPPLARRLPGKDTRVQGVARRILQFIAGGSTAEKFIRGALGNNPDTSKALRLLLTQRKVHRVGDGGRGKAFMYVATQAGLRELEQLADRVTTDEDGHKITHQGGQISTLEDTVSPTSKAPDALLATSRNTSKDVDTYLPKTSFSHSVLQAVLGRTTSDMANL